jgi:serine/threonine protein phosphatase PrpC
VKRKRVDGDLAVSRAFGDPALKSDPAMDRHRQKVVADPEFTVYPRDGDSDEFIVLACDGIWDVATSAQCSAFCQNLLSTGELDLGHIAEEVVDMCLDRNSRDNLTLSTYY